MILILIQFRTPFLFEVSGRAEKLILLSELVFCFARHERKSAQFCLKAKEAVLGHILLLSNLVQPGAKSHSFLRSQLGLEIMHNHCPSSPNILDEAHRLVGV